MKKILTKLSLIIAATFFVLSPSVVLAQEEDIIDIETEETTSIPATGAPDTGIAPPENKAVQNAAVFIGGSLLGAGIGLGVLKLKKNSLEK